MKLGWQFATVVAKVEEDLSPAEVIVGSKIWGVDALASPFM
jgi:hypothetical protein